MSKKKKVFPFRVSFLDVAIWLRSAQKDMSFRVYLLHVYLLGRVYRVVSISVYLSALRVYPCLSFCVYSCLFVVAVSIFLLQGNT